MIRVKGAFQAGGLVSRFGLVHPEFASGELFGIIQGRTRNPNPNFLVQISSGGVGVFHVKGRQKVRHVPRSQGKTNFLAGYPGILPGYPGGARKVRGKNVCVQFLSPNNPDFFSGFSRFVTFLQGTFPKGSKSETFPKKVGTPNLVIFFSLTEAPVTDPTPDPTQHPRSRPETDLKRSQTEPNGAERSQTEPKWTEIKPSRVGRPGGGFVGMGGVGGLQGKKENHYPNQFGETAQLTFPQWC